MPASSRPGPTGKAIVHEGACSKPRAELHSPKVVPDVRYIVVGRSRDCDLVLSDASVSGRHARLSWRDGNVFVEDLGSANGTWVRGRRVENAVVRPGDDVRFGRESLAWSDKRLKPFLRSGARGDTVTGMTIPGRRFICGACGARGVMPDGFTSGELRCGVCEARLIVGPPRKRWAIGAAALGVVLLGGILGAWVWAESDGGPLRRAAERLGIASGPTGQASPRSAQEASIRAHTLQRVLSALDPTSSATRNEAVQIAATDQGPYKVEQVARLWTHVRGRWRYVNDPRGGEYFATASETIRNDYAGDCDDFAILLAAMNGAIGGEARVVMMDGPRGGHAYTEACIHDSPEEVARRLARHYRRSWDQYLGRQRIEQIHFRSSEACPVWLNLDWNAGVPGGPYEPESWAVAIYPDGTTETLAPAGGSPVEAPAAKVRTSALPPR